MWQRSKAFSSRRAYFFRMENEHVLGGLTRKRGKIAGQIEHTQALLRKLVTELEKIDAAILVSDPEANPHAIPPKRRHRRAADWGAAHGAVGSRGRCRVSPRR